MHLSIVHLSVVTLYLLTLAEAKAVFAHYMVRQAHLHRCRYQCLQKIGR